MNKTWSRLSALLLCVLMLTACAASGSDLPADAVKTSEKTQAAAALTAAPNAAAAFEHDPRLAPVGETPIAKEPVTLNIVYATVADLSTNYASNYLHEKSGFTFNYILYAYDAFKEKVNLALATGEAIDLIISPNQGVAKFSKVEEYKFAQQGLLTPLNDYIEHASVNIKNLFEKWPEFRTNTTTPDGNIYSLQAVSREGFGTYHGTASYKMWINQTWLDRLELQAPTTTEEFKDVLKAFKENDANGNGDPNDEIPLSTCIAGANVEIDGFLMNAFTYNNPLASAIAPYIRINDAGKVECSVMCDEYRQGIEYLAGLCSEGLLYADSFTQDRATQAALNVTGDAARIGALPAQHLGYLVTSFKDSERYQEYTWLLPLKGPNGVQLTTNLHPSGGGYPNGLIPYTAQSPEAAFRLLDFICCDEIAMVLNYGEKGVTWDDADADSKAASGEPASFKTLQVITGDTSAYTMTGWPAITDVSRSAGVSQDPKAPQGAGQEYILWHATRDYEPFKVDTKYVFPTIYYSEQDNEAMATYKATLNSYIIENKAAFITGSRDLNTEWDAFLSELDAMGMQEYLALLQKNYDIYVNSTK